MTANLYPKRGTWQYCLIYYAKREGDNSPDTEKPVKGIRRQKWVDTKLSNRGNKKKAEAMETDIVNDWGLRLEPWNYLSQSNKGYEETVENSKASTAKSGNTGKSTDAVYFADVLIEWLKVKKASLQVSSYINYEQTVLGRIEPFFREEQAIVSELTDDDISEFYSLAHNDGEGVSAATIAHYHTYIRQALDYAVQKGHIKHNPAYFVKKPRKETFISDVYSEGEVDSLFTAFSDDPLFVVVVIAIYCGLRKSEIIGLEWNAVNFVNKSITIRQVAYKHKEKGKPVEQKIKKEMKSRASYRTMPLPPEVEDVLLWHKERQKRNKRRLKKGYNSLYENFICVNELGDWIKLDYVCEHFKLKLQKNGLKEIRFHDLRHSCASILFNNGAQQRDIQDYLGHADIQTTNRYTHTSYTNKISTAQTASKVLPNPLSKPA